jgi:hypothetical protein
MPVAVVERCLGKTNPRFNWVHLPCNIEAVHLIRYWY